MLSTCQARIIHRGAIAAALTLVATLALSGCGSNGDGKEASEGDSVSLSSADQEHLDALYEGTSTEPATEGPAPQPGKNIWIISPGESVSVVTDVTSGMTDAAKIIGWDAKIFDAQLQPTQFLAGVEQAVAAKADGIILYGIDCAYVKAGLEAAKKAGIPVVGSTAQDCPDEHLLTQITFAVGSFEDLSKSYGEDGVLWMVAHSGPKAKFIELAEFDSASTTLASGGYREALKRLCPDCTNVPVEYTADEIGPKLQEKAQQALVQHPDAVGLYASYDAIFTSGVSAAVVASGMADKLNAMGGGGVEASLDLIREGRGQSATLYYPSRWEGFAAVDYLNRLMNGEEPTAENAPTGIGVQLIDKDHNMPESGPVQATIDYEAAYKKAWGIAQ